YDGHHAMRFANGVTEHIAFVCPHLEAFTSRQGTQIGKGTKVLNASPDIQLARLLPRSARIGNLRIDKGLKPLFNAIRNSMQDARTLYLAGLPPGAMQGGASGTHCTVYKLCIRLADLAKLLAIHW